MLLVAGEASGDLHGARLLSELRELLPELRVFGLGGRGLREAGMEAVADFSRVSVVGIAEVLRVLPRARRIFRQLLEEADRRKPAVAVLIDFPEFNLRLARQLKERGTPVIYYVSPQIWAWRRGRLKIVSEAVDKMLVLFPFETDFYRGRVDVQHVGHPLVDEVPQLSQAWDPGKEPTGQPGDEYRVALLPGSRSSEIMRLLPVLLETAGQLAQRLPVTFSLIQAPSVAESAIEGQLARSDVEIRVVREDRFEAIAGCHLAICASGTATLEVGLLRTPMVVVYRVGGGSYLLGRLLVRVPFISLVNLVLGARVVPELIQREVKADRIAAEALRLLQNSDAREEMRKELGRLRTALGSEGASRRAALQVSRFLTGETR
jgi:lipid-A-disaccharide synthase